jgi:hypothetical protein
LLLQLDPPLPVYIPARNQTGLAHLVIDYGPESHLIWVIATDAGGEIWSLPNPQVRLQTNFTMGRTA